ncbi:hypothetical protein GLIP_3102 [Aliiglaciecola lipolytica E3]|uniref:Uncharacterized protein n=1 Tax=Aliiglaciecola lipolytica E3 TaxID=1127673 RepID=K6YGG4_9ALTE|nr:hypothetical protein GLIP_3102 [Aliiglaciecola lipolytica E3]
MLAKVVWQVDALKRLALLKDLQAPTSSKHRDSVHESPKLTNA